MRSHILIRTPIRVAAILAALFSTLPAHGEGAPQADRSSRPRIGLALSAGGARGLAHVGVLKVLEENGIHIDCIAGTSMGAVIGALYASGYSADQIESIVRSVDWQHVFSSKPERPLVPLTQRIDLVPAPARVGLEHWKIKLPRSIDSDYRINRLLTKVLTGPDLAAGRDFDRLPIPFRTVAADLKTGDRIVLERGNLARAVRASLSVPVILVPVEDGDRLLIDGGIVDELPVGVVRDMGADVVLAVDTRAPPLPPERYRDAIGVAGQLVDVLAEARNAAFAQHADITITPNLEPITPQAYDKFDQAMALGHESAIKSMERIRQRLGTADPPRPSDGDSLSSQHFSSPATPPERVVENVRIMGNRSVREGLIRDVFAIHPGLPFDLDAALRGIDALHATRLFESLWLDVQTTPTSGIDLTVHLTEAWRWTAEAGLSYNEADRAGILLRLLTLNLWGWGENLDVTTMVNNSIWGARVRLAGDRLLTPAVGFYLQARGFEETPQVFHEHDLLNRARFDVAGGTWGLQRQIGPSVLVRAGVGIERVRTRFVPGVEFPAARDRISSLELSAVWDRLDDRYSPTRGAAAEVYADASRLRDLDASSNHDYRRLIFRGRSAASVGRFNLIDTQLMLGASGGDMPVYKLFRIGGPLIPGLHRDELWGRQAAAVGIGYGRIVWRELRLSLRAGAGDVWPTRNSVSWRNVQSGWGIGLDYPIKYGPLSVLWGHSDQGESHVYLATGFQQPRQD